MKKYLIFIVLTLAVSCAPRYGGSPVVQQDIARVNVMATMPEPYALLDWHQKALDFDSFAFDFNNPYPCGPVIWLDDARRNIDQTTFGLYTAMADARQGADVNGGEFHESLNILHALLGAGLNGIDKTNQNGYNWVKMAQNYFNTDNGWNIVMNNTCPEVALLGGGYGRDWWYDVYPNILFYAVSEVFPGVDGAEQIQRTVADQFAKADSVLNGNYDFTYFDYSRMEGCNNWIPKQQDAAGGHAWVLYSAYQKFGDEKYLQHAISAMEALNGQKESRFYEILLPMGVYTAARLNAEQGCNFDIAKMLDWIFDGCTAKDGRNGWGITAGRWGDYDIGGLQGSLIDGGGYAFLMNSIDVAWPFVPMVKYQPQFARAIGRWMLNNVNSCRLFFPDQIPDSLQCLPGRQDYTGSIVAYEGLRKTDDRYMPEEHRGLSPIALGDGPLWNEKNPRESMFSLYSTSAVGILGAIVAPTDVEGILRLDCNATDFYASKPYPVYLYYNPHTEAKTVTYQTAEAGRDLLDIVSGRYLARKVSGPAKIHIPAGEAALIVELPAGKKVNNNTVLYEKDI